MFWIIAILIIVVVFLFKANQETLELSKVPFEKKYKVLLDGLNIALFDGEATFITKDIRQHHLVAKRGDIITSITFINRKDTLYLTYTLQFKGREKSVDFYFSSVSNVTEEQQERMVVVFCNYLLEKTGA